MKSKILKFAFAVSLLLFFQSCDGDSETPTPTVITATDFTANVDENSPKGTSLGKVSASANQGELSYNIFSQTVSGALEINSETGELSIADIAAFDFETNKSIAGKIKITVDIVEEEINFTIKINDVTDDEISKNLTTSKNDYANAKDGNWITITKIEYEKLESNIKNISYAGMNKTQFIDTPVRFFASQSLFVSLAGPAIEPIPENSYVFAFKYVRVGDITSENAQVKISVKDSVSGFTKLGNVLPITEGAITNTHYYVLKRNNTSTTDRAYVGFYSEGSVLGRAKVDGDILTNYTFGDAETNSATSNNVGDCLYQAMSTTKSQW